MSSISGMVNVGVEESYEIFISRDASELISDIIESIKIQGARCGFVVDAKLFPLHEDFFKQYPDIPVLKLAAGEKNKNLDSVKLIYDFMLKNNFDRKSSVFAIGGGTVGDMTGFAAATYMRGIAYHQVPSTLLAMVDSSIGGKTGVNLAEGKSLVGAFHQPKKVIVHLNFLSTLPEKEFAAGMAEVIKSALLADASFFDFLENQPLITAGSPSILEVIEKTAAIKATIVAEDPNDLTGKRALLNLGHTFAHAIETASNFKQYLHGEAVAIGLILAARLSELLGHISPLDVQRIRTLIEKYKLPTQLYSPLKIGDLLRAMMRDKKTELGELHFICLRSIGKAYLKNNINPNWLNLLWKEVGAID